MKIVILSPQDQFSEAQRQRLMKLGEILYTKHRDEYPLQDLIQIAKDCDILAVSPANLGGFEHAKGNLVRLMEAIPTLKGMALSTTSFGFVDLDYCRKRNIPVTNVPYYSTESVAEHTLAFLLGCAKRIFLSDRMTQKGNYQLIKGFELKGKTLGVIGLGHIGSRVAELGKAIGMNVIGWNRSPKELPGITIMNLEEVLRNSDAISICLADNQDTLHFISREQITML